jgi:hypothetical protein
MIAIVWSLMMNSFTYQSNEMQLGPVSICLHMTLMENLSRRGLCWVTLCTQTHSKKTLMESWLGLIKAKHRNKNYRI